MKPETKVGIALGILFLAFIVFASLAIHVVQDAAGQYAECRKQGTAPDICLAEPKP